MRTIDTASALRAFVRATREDDKRLGFVPTMGALHEGHLSLMRKARAECDRVLVSIFVNPTQFAAGEDYERYPRTLDRDSRLAQEAGVDVLFVPPVRELYSPGAQTVVSVPDLARRWEGEARPGHFDGVATVCAKLFNLAQPDRAYFGRKDYQQLRVIEQLVADLCMPLSIVPMPTVREQDGLALSSRNAYLSPDERRAAPALYRALRAAAALFEQGERSGPALRQAVQNVIAGEPLLSLDYVAIVDAQSLEPVEAVEAPAVALIAARLGSTRLIDNLLLGATAKSNSSG